ncbi:MAG TPA: SMC family ATPase [Rhodothermales bacterium]|nr:SMC family ATPase [Rhodothermales bacterium]
MIPVSLRLKNFMSYGTAAPELDFEQFQVACLSGNNGQGKSALLEAITWSLWGEARKSSGTQKPDEELLRIGEREMQVDFVFDIEGERYRVVRSYAKSASGKTNKSQLELHLLEAEKADYRPLTGTTMRETQAHIDNVIGLDYDTFINSAFLLQGRSDEFTKKRPSERKEILARILNLSRYEALYDLAAGRERDARKAVEQTEMDTERLEEALKPEPEWKAQHGETRDAIDAQRTHLQALRTEERSLAERLSALDARAREVAELDKTILNLKERQERFQRDAEDYRERIAKAEILIERREFIQRDHERFLELTKERDELDTRSELFRGLEKQQERTEAEMRERKNDLERKLERIEYDMRQIKQQIAECEAQLAEAPSVERQLQQALAARAEAEKVSTLQEKRRALDEQIAEVEKRLLQQREALSGKLKALEDHVQSEQRALPDVPKLEAQQAALQRKMDQREALQNKLTETEERGKSVAEDLHKLSTELKARQESLAEQSEQLTRLQDSDEGNCPTCGTELTEAHRQEVAATLQSSTSQLQQAIRDIERKVSERKTQRESLLEQYKTTKQNLSELDGIPEQIALVREQLRHAQERREGLAKQEKEIATLRQTLNDKAYGAEDRARHQALRQEREALPFDAEAFQRIQNEAAQVTRFEERKRALVETEGRREQLTTSLQSKTREATALREKLDDGSEFALFQDKLRQLDQQMKDLGFDPQRFRKVKQLLEKLGDAGARMTDLVNAQQNHADWKERLVDVLERNEKLATETEQKTRQRAEVEAKLGGKEGLESQLAEQKKKCHTAETQLFTLQKQEGQLIEKLEKAARDREQLKEVRSQHKKAVKERNLYRQLKVAFSKHGIPSLIIEQTLPEIEERTNDLLERLTDGRMHIRLETLKDKKTGGTKETLEIRITDEQGVSRPYETFSGGEAFRVNFALRIALAQLLAERSGVRVRTLVVDEGFGTQDQQGVQNLVEAIQLIQDDFDKILVITHLPEMKEVFPVRIEVEKDPVDGSRFEVIGV